MQKVAKIEMVLSMLPALAAEVAQPLTACRQVTMVANGDGEIGVARLAGEVISVMENLTTVVNKMSRADMRNI